ncbi:MAG: DUF47 family protein [Gemmatimonadota bacterium]|nr:DUF47 family protein [Gemmatimonadota bacterium]
MRLIPRDEGFFDLFAELAKRLTSTATLLEQLFAEPAKVNEYVSKIKDVEHEADNLTHEVISRIDRSFVTPIDREDIHELASQLDNVIDLVDGTARRAAMFHITAVHEPAKQLCNVLVRAAKEIQSAVTNMKKSKLVVEHARIIKGLEEEGDAIYHIAVGALFSGTPDPIEVIKWKELYDTLERAIDQAEDVANVLESIALKHA